MLSDNETIKPYMQHVSAYERVTPDEEVNLAARIKHGDEEARQQLVRSNLRLVVKIAHDFFLRAEGPINRSLAEPEAL